MESHLQIVRAKYRLKPEHKLIEALCRQIDLARTALVSGKPISHAITELDYASVIVADDFAEYPELTRAYVKVDPDEGDSFVNSDME